MTKPKVLLISLLAVGFLLFCGIFALILTKSKTPITSIPPQTSSSLSESEARIIAEKTCIKGGESLAPGYYNENSKTWWFDANLNATKEGCNPACVVSEDTRTAEINWRCTGLVLPKESAADAILNLFKQKYPKYADTMTITISKETSDHARGSISMVSGEPGGMFLAVKIADVWQLVFDGNGNINCSQVKNDFNFTPDFLTGLCD